jgi:hypothetical protein
MSADQRWTRMQEISKSTDRASYELSFEFAKLLLGPDAEVID